MEIPLLESHLALVADRPVQEAFRRAVQRAVFPGAVVLDLGTGTGIHAIFACQAGARRVYAVDWSPIVDVARVVARRNDVADRVVFIRAPADELELPERVDIIVAHHGVEELLALVPSAVRRFLKPGGRVIPDQVELFAVPVEGPDTYDRFVGGWVRRYDVDFTPVQAMATNTVFPWLGRPEDLLGRGASLGVLRLAARSPQLDAEVALPIARAGDLHGIGTWTVETLVEGEAFSTAPPTTLSRDIWRDYFFPTTRPVPVDRGDVVTFAAATGAGGWGRLWRWRIEVRRRDGTCVYESTHSSLAGAPLSLADIKDQALDRRPSLSPRGEVVRFVLERLDGRTSLGELETAVAERFGDRFESADDVAALVAGLVARYTR